MTMEQGMLNSAIGFGLMIFLTLIAVVLIIKKLKKEYHQDLMNEKLEKLKENQVKIDDEETSEVLSEIHKKIKYVAIIFNHVEKIEDDLLYKIFGVFLISICNEKHLLSEKVAFNSLKLTKIPIEDDEFLVTGINHWKSLFDKELDVSQLYFENISYENHNYGIIYEKV
ncbi:MAG: hypothetical protein K9W44_14175 [Candidatus Lokiarchaeota archaeon]|nr:hypothetical protein [Candidatus Harpocratesius repetitus]